MMIMGAHLTMQYIFIALGLKTPIQAYNSICGYFCIGFIDFLLKGKSMLAYTNLFSTNEYVKNDNIILKCFLITKKVKIKR